MRFKPLTLVLLVVVGIVLLGTLSFLIYAYTFLEYVTSDDDNQFGPSDPRSHDGVRSEFERRLAIAIKGRAQIGSITCSLMHGTIKLLDVELDPTPRSANEPKLSLRIREITIPWKWSNVVLNNRLDVETLDVKQANLLIISRNPAGGDADSGLNPNLPPQGAMGPDGAIQAPGGSFSWLLHPLSVTISDSKITLQDFKGKIWATLSGLEGKTEQAGTGTILHFSAGRFSVPNSPFALNNVQFPLPLDLTGVTEVKDWTADAPFGPISGSIQVVNGRPTLAIRSSVANYNAFVGCLGFDSSAINGQGPLTFESTWTGFESGHITGMGQLTLSDSHLLEIPAFLHLLTQLSPKLDPISGHTTFVTKLDLAEQIRAETAFSAFQVQAGLPDYTEQKAPAPAGKHHSAAMPTTVPSTSIPQLLISEGSAELDSTHSTFSGAFSTAVSAGVASRLNSILKPTPPISGKWYTQLKSVGNLDNLVLITVPPPALPAQIATSPVATHPATPPAPPSSSHHRKKH